MRILDPVIGAQALLGLTEKPMVCCAVPWPSKAMEFAVIEENPGQLHIGT
jgi:hypothetical protein